MAIGPWQIILVVLVLVLLFGAGRIAALGRGLGEGIRNFKRGLDDREPKRLGDAEKR
jgi:sec-independent protein translocase protein TatA